MISSAGAVSAESEDADASPVVSSPGVSIVEDDTAVGVSAAEEDTATDVSASTEEALVALLLDEVSGATWFAHPGQNRIARRVTVSATEILFMVTSLLS